MNIVWLYNGVRLEARNDAGTLLGALSNDAPMEIDLAHLALALNQLPGVNRLLLGLSDEAEMPVVDKTE
jgi:hypothetical protein